MALTAKEEEKLARQRAAARRRKKNKKAALDKKSPANQGKKLTVRESNANRITLPTGKSQISHIQSGDFYSGDHEYAGRTLSEQAEAQGKTLSSVRRDRRLDFDRNEQRAVTEQNLAKVKAGEMTLTEALQGTVDHQRITRSPGGRKTQSYKQERKGTQKEQVLEQTGLPEYYKSNKDGTRNDGKGKYVYALNTGYGIDIPEGYELDGSKQSGATTPGEYVRLREKKTKEWYEDPGQLIKMGTIAAISGGVGLAAAPALGAVASGALSGATSGVLSGARGDDLLKSAALGAVSPVLSKIPGLNDPNLVSSFGRNALADAGGQLISDGSVDLGDALKSGAIGTTIDIGKDILADARQTNTGNLKEGYDTIDNTKLMDASDVERLTNTTDAYGLLGDKGLLAKLGLDVDYMPTDYIGSGLDFLGLGDRSTSNNYDAAKEQYDQELEGLRTSGNLNEATLQDAQDRFYANTARYDERALKFLPRGDATRTGIYEFLNEAPGAGTGFLETLKSSVGIGDTFGDRGNFQVGSPADVDTTFTPLTDSAFKEFMESNPTASIGDDGVIYPSEPVGPNKPTPEEVEEYVEDIFTGDPDLSGVDENDRLRLGPGDREVDTGDTYNEPKEPYVPSTDTDPYPEEVTEPEDPYPPPTPPPTPPPPTTGGGGSDVAAERARRKLKAGNPELFRLARIMQVEGLPQSVYEAALGRISGILAGREGSDYEGDVTRDIDPLSGRYIQRVKGERGETRRRAMLRELKEKEMTT